MVVGLWRYSVAGLLLLVPAWATFLILITLLYALNGLFLDLPWTVEFRRIPGLSIALLILLVLTIGMIATHVIGRRVIVQTEAWIEQIPLVRSVYVTLKGMTDLLNFRSRFGRSTVVAFPFPRDGLWAIGFIMGIAPGTIQVVPASNLLMVFVPTAIHPFTGFLAFIPQHHVRPLNVSAEDAMKMEFTAGLYKPETGWLRSPKATA